MRKPLEARAGLGRAWAGLATARGGLRGGASPACGVLGARASYRSRFLAQTTREALGGSPRLKSGRSCSGAGSTSRSGGGGGVMVADWLQGCIFGLPSPADRCARSLRGSHGVSGHGAEPGEWDCGGRTGSPPVASGANPKASRVGVAVAGLGKLLGHRRSFRGGSGWLWSGGPALARRRRGSARRWCGGAARRVGLGGAWGG